jgi:hypothetical protein
MKPGPENPEQLILGIAGGLEVPALEPFVLSLRRSGYRGRTRLFVERKDRKAREFLVRHGIEVEEFAAAREPVLAFAGALHLPHWAARLLELGCLRALQPLAGRSWGRALYARLAPLDVTALRYVLYRLCLAGPAGAGVRQVFLVDTRDVIFQSAPFDFAAPAEGLVCFFEDASMPIGRCAVNSTWVQACYGRAELAALRQRGIFCSGATFGERAAVERYLDAMITEIARVAGWRFVSPRGFDQACHNHLLHLSPPAPFAGRENGAGPVINLSHRPAQRLAFSPEGLLLDDAGRVVPVVHQWDRHAASFQEALARLRHAQP